MNKPPIPVEFSVGSELIGPTRVVSDDRLVWFGSGFESAVAGVFTPVGVNIHTDTDFAKSQGLGDVIADGMLSTNWISCMMTRYFGLDYLEHGELRTKYIKPVLKDILLKTRGRIRAITSIESAGDLYDLDVWCEDCNGVRLTDGEAKVLVTRQLPVLVGSGFVV